MAPQQPNPSLHLLKETRCRTSARPGSIVQIQVTPPSSFGVRSRDSRRIVQQEPIFDTQEEFKSHYLASSTSIYHASTLKYPRSFQWRVLRNQHILEIRSVDLSKSEDDERDAHLVLQLCFNSAIKHDGVALADIQESDTLFLFALTKSNEIYTLALKPEFFCTPSATEADPAKWCKVSRPASFSITAPHRLIALDPHSLLVSLSDGRLLRLTRREGSDGAKWTETIYGEGQWAASLRGLVKWQAANTIRYDGIALDQHTPLNIAVAPDGKHIFAVCMNHTLRAWDSETGAVIFTKDLLWRNLEHDSAKTMLDPNGPHILEILKTPEDQYALVTFSPQGNGQFKFWGVRDLDFGDSGIRDLFPDDVLKVPDPDPRPDSKAIWKLVDFAVKTLESELSFCILLRSGHAYKAYNLKTEMRDLATRWQDQWTEIVTSPVSDEIPQGLSSPEEAADEWTRYITAFGKYPLPVIENALRAHCVDRSIEVDTKLSLEERLKAAVSQRAKDQNLKSYEDASLEEWGLLWQDIRDFNRLRFAAMSLAIDDQFGGSLLFTDACSMIRSCSKLEIIAHNTPDILAVSQEHLEMPSIEVDMVEPKLPDELALVLEVATSFRSTFDPRLQRSFDDALSGTLSRPREEGSLKAFYEQSSIGEVEDGLFDDLTNRAFEPIGGLSNLETQIFTGILETLSHLLPDVSSELAYTSFGLGTLNNGAQDMIQQRYAITKDLLALIVFLAMEVDHESTPMDGFDAARAFDATLNKVRQYRLLQWLVKTPRGWQSMLESIFAVDLKPQAVDVQSPGQALTHGMEDLIQWALGGNDDVPWDEIPVSIMCDLLVHQELDQATQFLQFLSNTPWATYIRGRLALMLGNFDEAANLFKSASDLSKTLSGSFHHASRGLLSPIEAAYFGQGLPTYYSHIIQLFNTAKQPSYAEAANFAEIALQNVRADPTSDEYADLLLSLFDACLQIKDFGKAYSALERHSDPQSGLPRLIDAILRTPNRLQHLLSIHWDERFLLPVDEILTDSGASPKTLAAWRIEKSQDLRGAAAALLPSLYSRQAKVRRSVSVSQARLEGAELETEYLTVINLLACAGKENAWVLSGGGKQAGAGGAIGKRKVVTLEDVRGMYEQELDRRSVIEGGRFAYAGGDGDIDMED